MTNSFAKILQFAFNSPIIVHDYMAFAMLNSKFKTNTFVIYCDQEDKENYNKILKALIKARRELPINLKPDAESGHLENKQRHSDVIFVLSTIKNLMPVVRLKEEKPQGVLITPEDNFVDLFTTYLSKLEKVEGLSKEDFLQKAFNNDKEFAPKPEDDDQ